MRISNGHMCQIRAPGQPVPNPLRYNRQRSKCVLSRDGQDSHGTSRLMSFSHRMASEVVVRNRTRPINVYYPCERVTETRTSDTETRTETGPNPVRGLCARPSRISCGGSTMTRRESDRTKTRAGSLRTRKSRTHSTPSPPVSNGCPTSKHRTSRATEGPYKP